MVGAGKGRNGKECLTRGEEEEKERFGNWIAPNEADLFTCFVNDYWNVGIGRTGVPQHKLRQRAAVLTYLLASDNQLDGI